MFDWSESPYMWEDDFKNNIQSAIIFPMGTPGMKSRDTVHESLVEFFRELEEGRYSEFADFLDARKQEVLWSWHLVSSRSMQITVE